MRRIGLAAVSLLAVAIAGGAMAQTATPPTSVLEEMTAEIPKVDEHEARMVVAEIAPGEATAWHTHPSPVLAYVLEGTITLEHDRQGPMEYAAGQAFMEAANHKVRALNNGNGPVKILAIQLADPSAPFTVPAQ